VVFRLCVGFLADRTEAEDAAQDAMLHLLDRLAAYDARRPWNSWRNTVVLNHCRDRLRRRTTRRTHEDRAPASTTPLPSPHDVAAAKEVAARLEEALAALTPREREAFVLRDLQGCSTEDAATILGIGASSVRSLVTLARRRLRTLLASCLPEGSLPGGAA
jgi:RNA polymerase sigma-70 factor (ECF subfamily)